MSTDAWFVEFNSVMTDPAEQNGDRQSFSEPRDSSSLLEQQQQLELEQEQQQQQQQQHHTSLIRTAQALKRTRARDIFHDGTSEIPAEKRAALARRDIFDHTPQPPAQYQASRLSSQSSSQRDSEQSQQRKAPGDPSTARTSPIDSAILYSKTWKLHRTTPFYRYDARQAARDGSELLSYMTANAPKLAMAETAVAQAAASIAAAASGGDGQSVNNTHPASVITAAGGAMSALSITERASRPFPPQINQEGENIVQAVDVVNEVKSVVFHPLDIDPGTEDEEEEEVRRYQGNSFIISIVISFRGKSADQTSYIALIDNPSKRTSTTNGDTAMNNNPSPFTPFTLVMTKAPMALSALVMEWLERKYDCRISPLVIPTYELRAFVSHWLEYLYGNGDENDVVQTLRKAKVKQVELHYGLPTGVQGLKTISVSLASEDVRELYNSREANSEIGLLEGIEDHCSDSMHIDFGRLSLTRVGCPSWYIASEGKLKIHPIPPGKQSLDRLLQTLIKHGT
ncbi:hypothetical protein BGZ73_008856 [Actinomortierella ambigua]|nr:hypothetical protein BGZ73_008856 [Actinomortierella ambigua]